MDEFAGTEYANDRLNDIFGLPGQTKNNGGIGMVQSIIESKVSGASLDKARGRKMTTEESTNEAYPLVLRHMQEVKGQDFIAVVHMQAPVLLVKENEGWYLYGVRPGVFSAFGSTKEEAMLAGRMGVSTFFSGLAAAETRDNFEKELELLRENIDKHDEERWILALRRLRSREIHASDDLSTMKRHKVVGKYPFALTVSFPPAEVEQPELSADDLTIAA